MKKFLREPLVHFLFVGAALFALYRWAADGDEVDPQQRIVVNEGRIEQFATVFAKTWQRPPTREELEGLVDDFVLEEIYYRQAVAMGIDRDDTVIRRRLRQKLEFLTDDATSLIEPSDDQLGAYLRANESQFRESPKYTFRQIYFNPEKHGQDPKVFLVAQLTALRDGETVAGDSSLVPESFQLATAREIDRTFGLGFASQLEALETGQWEGPLRSGLGAHLVRIDQRQEGRLPELEDIRDVVEREWRNENRLASRKAINASLRDQYDVIVEWPASVPSSQADSTQEPTEGRGENVTSSGEAASSDEVARSAPGDET